MLKHPVIDLLKSFSSSEVEQFRKFINSPFFNTSKKMVLLFESLVKYYPAFNDLSLTKESLYKEISAGEKFKDSTIRDYLSILLELLAKYLIQVSLGNKSLEKYDYLLNELLVRNQPKLIAKVIKGIKGSSSSKIDLNYFHNIYKLKSKEFNYLYFYEKSLSKKDIKNQVNALTVSGINLFVYFITQALNQYFILSQHCLKYNYNIQNNSFCKLLEGIDLNKLLKLVDKEIPEAHILKLYGTLYSLIKDPLNNHTYKSYKKLFEKYHIFLNFNEAIFHISNLINYSTSLSKTESTPGIFHKELFKLYELMLIYGYHKEDNIGCMQNELFRNMLVLSLSLKKYKWTCNYIENYINDLSPGSRENMRNFAYAYYNYEMKNYDKALKYLNDIKADNFIYKYDLKNLLLKIYYELGYYEEAISLIHTYKEFLRINELVYPQRRLRHLNFLKYLLKLIRVRVQESKEPVDEIKKDILDIKNISYKVWLVNKCDEFKNKKYSITA